MNIALVYIRTTTDSHNKIAEQLSSRHDIQCWAITASNKSLSKFTIVPTASKLATAALATYDLVCYCFETSDDLDSRASAIAHQVPGLVVLGSDFALPTNADQQASLANLLATALGLVVPDKPIGEALDGLSLGDVTIAATDAQTVPNASPNIQSISTSYAQAITTAADLALARRPYLELAQDVAARLSQAGLSNDATIVNRATEIAFELFDLK